jgi:hypothetical protein
MARRANGSTPPKPASDIFANAKNSAIRLGGTSSVVAGAKSGSEAAAGVESEDIIED